MNIRSSLEDCSRKSKSKNSDIRDFNGDAWSEIASNLYCILYIPPLKLVCMLVLNLHNRIQVGACAVKTMPIDATEICAEVDKDNNCIGSVPRAVLRSSNVLHRATYIFVFDSSRSQLLVQRRTPYKDYCPNMLDACFGGVVMFGESFEENAERELAEEIGLPSSVLIRSGITALYEDEHTRVFGDIYNVQLDRDISELKLEVEEVASVSWMEIEEVIHRVDEFTPDSINFLLLLLNQK